MKMRSLFRSSILVFIAVVLTFSISGCSEGRKQPNILFIITDDQGYGDISLHGNPYLETPNIDLLGQQSVRFDRFYVSSVCAPSRASILTGRYNLRTGAFGVTRNMEAIRAEEVTLAEALGSGGYYTTCIGKWHSGIQFPYNPEGQGFDEFFGFTGGHINNYFDAELLRGTETVQTEGYITDVLTDEAIRFIKSNKEKPFFCYLSYNAPHGPWQVPDEYYDKYRAMGFDEVVSSIWGMCENIDDNIGRLMELLEEEGMADNTLVLFLTDNGGTKSTNIYNAGMRGGKTSVHEGGTRVPLFMRWPAAGWEPHLAEPLTAHIDLFPTLLDLCNVEPPEGPPVDGVSLRPLLEGDTEEWQERILYTHNPIDETNRYPGAVRTPKYRLVKKIKGPQAGSAAVNNDESATPWELYDMVNDPGEQKNIAKDNPEIVAELSRKYEEWVDDVSSEGLERMPLPVGYSEHNPVTLFAPQSYFSDPIDYFTGRGAANDWLTGWTDVQGKVWFDIDVVEAGIYGIEIALACQEQDAGAEIRVVTGESELETVVPFAPIIPVPLQDRAPGYKSRIWTILEAGEMELTKGKQQLTIEAVSIPGSQVMDFKHVSLVRLN
jgi:arylsulfatase A-like enzyme